MFFIQIYEFGFLCVAKDSKHKMEWVDVKLAGQVDCRADFQIFLVYFRQPEVPQNEATFSIYIQLFN